MNGRQAIIYERRRRVPRPSVMVAAAVIGAFAGVLWTSVDGVGASSVPASNTTRPLAQSARSTPASVSPAGLPVPAVEARSRPAASTSPQGAASSLSTQVAPNVHVTPIGVAPGQAPQPAGPREHDSEPEN
jgi:hypothetical protein